MTARVRNRVLKRFCVLTVIGLLGRPVAGADAAPAPPAPSADEPVASALSFERAGEFLDRVALDWTRVRKCGTCHTNYPYLLARPKLGGDSSAASAEIRGFFENRIAHWSDPKRSSQPRWDTEVVATAATLALHDSATSGKLHPLTRQALDRMWTLQHPDGSWTWLKCDWPPLEHDDYYGAVFAAVGVGHAPDDYVHSASAADGVARLRSFLRSTPPPSLHHEAVLLWASTRLDGLLDEAGKARVIDRLRALQRPDGGWSLPSLGQWARHDGTPNPSDAASDGYGTGLVVYVLRRAGVPASDDAMMRGAEWLRKNQRASGRWFTRSLSRDKDHYISNAGTAFSILALAECAASGR